MTEERLRIEKEGQKEMTPTPTKYEPAITPESLEAHNAWKDRLTLGTCADNRYPHQQTELCDNWGPL